MGACTTAIELYDRSPDVNEVANYMRAMDHAVTALRGLPLAARLVRETHAVRLEGVSGGAVIWCVCSVRGMTSHGRAPSSHQSMTVLGRSAMMPHEPPPAIERWSYGSSSCGRRTPSARRVGDGGGKETYPRVEGRRSPERT